jgi:glyoxylase-like metal-dependent hydrolase (beta-lactamase superfamily II)
MTAFAEVADRVWVARQAWFDVNITVVGGSRGPVVVDTHASGAAAEEVRAALRRLDAGRVVAVVNTHEHFDHTFVNAAFRAGDPTLPIHAHEVAAARTAAAGERIKAAYAADPDDPRAAEVVATPVVAADHLVVDAATIDLGDRAVELVHLGRGHTAGDLVVLVPDCGAVIAGDLVEESAPPAFGPDSHPLSWPATLQALVDRTVRGAVVVPGHGAPVDRAFAIGQQRQVAAVAATIRRLAAAGVPAGQALAAGEWPWDPAHLVDAVARGYAHLAAPPAAGAP